MARRIAEAAALRAGLRDRLVAATEAEMDKLEATEEVRAIYDFGPERLRLQRRLDDLIAGKDVQFRRWGDCVPGEAWPDRGVRLCVLVGDELQPADYEKVMTGSRPAHRSGRAEGGVGGLAGSPIRESLRGW